VFPFLQILENINFNDWNEATEKKKPIYASINGLINMSFRKRLFKN